MIRVRENRRGKFGRFEWLFAALIALWLFGLIFPATGNTENRDFLQVVALAWPIPVWLLTGRTWFLVGATFRGSRSIRIVILLFLGAVAVSSVLSVDPVSSLLYFAVTIVGFICCAGLWSCAESIEQAIAFYAYIGTALMIYVFAKGDVIQARLTFGHPNYLGLISFGILVSCFAVKSLYFRAALICVNVLIVSEAEARACLLASGIAILVYALLVSRSRWSQRRQLVVLIALVIGLPLIGTIYEEGITARASSLLLVDDRYRGLGTGFTGRLEAWQEAYTLFLQNPAFGVGYRRHEQFMTTLPSAHNGYLAMLAETGLMGILSSFGLIVICSARLFGMARAGDRIAIIGFAFVCGYLFVAMFDRYLVNFGSPTSVLMWIFLFTPKWARPGVQRISHGRVEIVATA